jgi:hypothetical protein
MLQSIDCGVYRVSEPIVYHYAGYECAAWWQDIRVEAGEYPVKAVLKDGRVENFSVSLPGVIVADNCQSLWGGMPIGESYYEKQNAGKPKSYHVHGRDYEVFQSINDRGDASPWLIDLSTLPNLGICLNPACGSRVTIYAGDRFCPRCASKRAEVGRAAIEKRHAFLVDTAWVVRPTRFLYLDNGRTNAYQRQELAAVVAGLRKVGPHGRKQARERYSPRVLKPA